MAGVVRALGKALRATGQALEGLGSSLQGSLAYKETREWRWAEGVLIRAGRGCNWAHMPRCQPRQRIRLRTRSEQGADGGAGGRQAAGAGRQRVRGAQRHGAG